MIRCRGLSCLAVLGAAVVIAGCSGSDSGPGVRTTGAHLYQPAPGAEPAIRVGWGDNIPDPSIVVAWLIYRGENSMPAAEARNLTDVVDSRRLPVYEDTRAGLPQITFSRTFNYLRFGSMETGTLTVTYDRPALQAGRSYFYRARRVVRERVSAPPISTTQATTLQVDPSTALGDASAPQGPVTYFLPPVPSLPSHGAPAVDPTNVTFRWSVVPGADQYQVRVYDNAQAEGMPVVQSPAVSPAGTTGQWTYSTGGRPGGLRANTTYYWVAGARRTGENAPVCGGESGWLKGAVRQFRTAGMPPPAP